MDFIKQIVDFKHSNEQDAQDKRVTLVRYR